MGNVAVMCSVYGAPMNSSEVQKDAHVPEFGRRLGTRPAERGCSALENCPDLFSAADGSGFFVIGRDVTDAVRGRLPPTAGCGESERIVLIPRAVLVAAKASIPDV